MPRIDPDQPLQPSVLDRLLDSNPELSRDPPKSRGQHLAELRHAIRRDLEALLNTRQRCRSWPEDLTELDRSLLAYGVSDFTAASLGSDEQRETFRREIEAVIRANEPRFVSVKVVLLENAERLDRTLRFRIEALMHADPAPEPVTFDSFLDPALRSVMIVGKGDG
jgi:type VI secretion system protein ImpF